MANDSPLEAVLKRDRLVVIGGLAGVIALAWAYILLGAGMDMSALEMTRMSAPAGFGSATDSAMESAGDIDAGAMSGMMETAMEAMRPMAWTRGTACLLYTSPSPRDGLLSRMPSSA